MTGSPSIKPASAAATTALGWPTALSDGPVIKPVPYQPPAAGGQRTFKIKVVPTALLGAALSAALVLLFLFSARSVELSFTPPAATVALSGGPAFAFGGIHLLLQDTYRLRAERVGHHPLDRRIEVGPHRDQAFGFQFVPLPGLLTIQSDPPGASVSVDGRPLGATPLFETPVPAGGRLFHFTHPRHQPLDLHVEVTGKEQPQQIQAELAPNWGDIHTTTEPPGARILVDGADTGLLTPAVVEILAGEHRVALALDGHETRRQRLLVSAGESRSLGPVKLKKADAILRVHTRPSGAGVTIDDQYQGDAPLSASLQSGRRYRVQVFKAGFGVRSAQVALDAGEARTLSLHLEQLIGAVAVAATPTEAQLYVDGQLIGAAKGTLQLPARPHRLRIAAPGHADYRTEVRPRPGLTLEVKADLMTLAEARMAALKPQISTSQGQPLKLLQPSPVTLGASRRSPGRRANETLREVQLTRLFYLGVKEVSNAEFRAFASGHDSGAYEDQTLNKDDQPAANLGWREAALYCNWLSRQENLPLFYAEEFGKVTGFDANAIGYRLPTEAEWAWAARTRPGASALLRFPWGDALPPPDRHGNYADRSAGHLVGRIIFGYNDNYAVAAPVGTFKANAKGFFDLGGNVAEWVNDYYQHPVPEGTGPLGPDSGEYHVIRGSSWMHGTVTDLRLSFRDYGIEGRRDVGFRIARFAEAEQ